MRTCMDAHMLITHIQVCTVAASTYRKKKKRKLEQKFRHAAGVWRERRS